MMSNLVFEELKDLAKGDSMTGTEIVQAQAKDYLESREKSRKRTRRRQKRNEPQSDRSGIDFLV